MGQATVDLPDPTKDLSTAHAGGADDLLAQLAGDEIDRLLAESDVETAAVEKAAPIAADVPLAAVAPTHKSTAAPAVAPDPTPQLEISQRAEIATVLADSESPALHEPDYEAEVHHAPMSTPWWLKPLLWMNAPLDALPDPLRDLIGKLAIATTANALAVLAYVALFRRHH